MPVRMLSSVDLPLPDGPLMANKLLIGTEKVMASRMLITPALLVMVLEIASARTSGSMDLVDGETAEVTIGFPFNLGQRLKTASFSCRSHLEYAWEIWHGGDKDVSFSIQLCVMCYLFATYVQGSGALGGRSRENGTIFRPGRYSSWLAG